MATRPPPKLEELIVTEKCVCGNSFCNDTMVVLAGLRVGFKSPEAARKARETAIRNVRAAVLAEGKP